MKRHEDDGTVKANLRLLYEQAAANLELLRNATVENEECAEVVRKFLSGPNPLVKEAEDAAARGDPETILMLLDNQRELEFVANNIQWLLSLGKYEMCLIQAYTATRTNNMHWPLVVLNRLFSCADKARLLAAGDMLPAGDTFTLYRGVAGVGKMRRPSGPSWTSDFETAKWFALRIPHLADPAIYSATVRREDVLFYSTDRGEQDFIVFVQSPVRMKLDLAGQKNAGWAGMITAPALSKER